MTRQLLIAVSLLLSSGSCLAIDIAPLGPRVWAATQPTERIFNDCNSLIVEADGFVIVVDAQESADDTAQIMAFAQDSIGKPVRYLINTHWHSDHTQGNTRYRDAYGDALIIVGHTTHPEDIFDRAARDLSDRVARTREALPGAREQLQTGLKQDGNKFTPEELAAQTARVERAEAWVAANASVTFTGPSKLVSEPWSVEAGEASFTVLPMRGHTRGDLVVQFTGLDVVATGDLLDAMPYAGHGFPKQWQEALESIRELDARAYLPGHGAVQRDTALIDRLIAYFDDLTGQVAKLRDAGKTEAEILEAIDLSASRDMLAGDDPAAQRFFDAVQGEAVERALLELEVSP